MEKNFVTKLFKSIMKAPFNGVDNINCRKEGENGNEERRKRDRF